MAKRKRKFNNKKRAQSFAKAVDGQLNDLREIDDAKSNFSVTYYPKETNYPCKKKTKNKVHENGSHDWAPEEGRDFGYSNEYWN